MACKWNKETNEWVYCCDDYVNLLNDSNKSGFIFKKPVNFCPYCGVKEEIIK